MSPTVAHALVRQISRTLNNCALIYQARQQIDIALARRQFTEYIDALESAGVRVRVLPEEPDLPDAVFVEDPVVVLDEIAILCRPASASRLGEVDAIAPAVSELRPIHRILFPGTLEGGDVLQIGRTLFVGISSRTNLEGIEQLKHIVHPFDYRVVTVAIRNCLHLKTAVTAVSDSVLLMNRDWVDLPGFECIFVDPSEPFAANALLTPRGVVMPAAFPRTIERVRRHGIKVDTVEADELAKAEGGVTCCSLLLNHD